MTIEERVAALEASVVELRPTPADGTSTLEERIAALEVAVAERKQTQEKPKGKPMGPPPGVLAMVGIFKDDPTLDEANAIGRFMINHGRFPEEGEDLES